ncbi:hypothetical protein V1478_006958 [Vespula squamosa]|uniref:Uncharacterized protein n=1 Tax=Vespula squamosa TaxID=30214 RepID=A0ABD2B1T9_VESSQ
MQRVRSEGILEGPEETTGRPVNSQPTSQPSSQPASSVSHERKQTRVMMMMMMTMTTTTREEEEEEEEEVEEELECGIEKIIYLGTVFKRDNDGD